MSIRYPRGVHQDPRYAMQRTGVFVSYVKSFFGLTDVVLLCINNEPRASQWGLIRVDCDLILLAFPVLGIETWRRESSPGNK